jgi:uncharacterized protein (UPF0548 family)
MSALRKPSEQAIATFLARQEKALFSYPEVGATRGAAPAGYDADHNRVELGEGAAVFEAACAALRRWEMFPRPWTEVLPADAPIQVGQTVVVLARMFGLWWLNAARVVYVLDEAGPPRRFGFAYGTLADHAERGEERFRVEWHSDGRVWYDLFAFSRPRHPLARLAYPLARRLQRRFQAESKAAMRRACEAALTSARTSS